MRYYLITILFLFSFLGYTQSIKVGVYPNPPLINIEEEGEVSGFCVDVLKEIAEKEGWVLEFQTYDFAKGLLALERGDIDIMPALAYSDYRDSILIMNETKVTTNWAKIYKNSDDDFNYGSLEQLRNKRIAVLKDDYYLQNGENGLLDLLGELDIPADIIEVNSYSAVIDNLSTGNTNLGLVSRYYGTLETEDKNVVKTPINVAYVSVRYGFSRNSANIQLAQQLDQQLQLLINDRSSIYYEMEKKYLSYAPQAFIPQWLWQAFGLVMAGLTIFAISILLQYKKKEDVSTKRD